MAEAWGWAGTAADFLRLTEPVLLQSLDEHHRRLWGTPASQSQVRAWRGEHAAMTTALRTLRDLPGALGWGVVFEYELPLEGGRRPDVVVLAGSALVVVEFKSTDLPTAGDVDQLTGYSRDLVDYHGASHDLPATRLLVLEGAEAGFARAYEGCFLIAPEQLAHYLQAAAGGNQADLDAWLHAPYDPLPTLVEAARRIFRDEPLPHIKAAYLAGVPETVELLGQVVRHTASSAGRTLAFVTGVPGAGKTLVGLQLVHDQQGEGQTATFLSGNGPLVTVLQDALRSRVFVKDLHSYVRTWGMNRTTTAPREHLVVFDEAQRAWDGAHMHFKHGVDASEPQLLLDIGGRIDGWAALVGLVGEGQEIHVGEEAGMAQWRDAAAERAGWHVHCPPKLADTFAGLDVTTHERLDLDRSLRSRRAERLHDWVRLLLEGSLPLAHRQADRVQAAQYPMYVTRSLDAARAYAREACAGQPHKRFGLLASSHARNLVRHGVDNEFMATSRMNVAKWYNAEADDPRSCCALQQPVTEFSCQGLELDVPIVCWGADARWSAGAWQWAPRRRRPPLRDPVAILRNTYRVLLTRGRDAVVLWVPPDGFLDETEHALLAAGVRLLPEPQEIVAAGVA